MAHKSSGAVLETRATVVDTRVRRYSFFFPVAAGADVAVEVAGQALAPEQYTVQVNVDRTGGSVTILGAGATASPAVLSGGDVVRMYRDTEVSRRTAFGTSGFAKAATAEVLAAYTNRVLEELADRLETHAEVILGRDDLVALIRQVTGTRSDGTRIVQRTDLAQDLQTDIAGAAEASTLSFLGTTLTIYDADGREYHVELGSLEGITLQKDGEIVGPFGAIKRLNFAGGVSINVSGDLATITLSAGTGVTAQQVETLIEAHDHVSSAARVELALRTESDLVSSAAMTQATSNALARLPGDPVIPVAAGQTLFDREFLVKVGSGSFHRFTYAELLAKPIQTNGGQAEIANAIQYSEGGNTYSIAHEGGSNRWLFAADNIGDYQITIKDSPILLNPALLPKVSGTESGILAPAEYARIHAAIDAEHLHDTPQVDNAHIEGTDAILFDDASVSTGSQLREIPFSELDMRWGAKDKEAAEWAREGKAVPEEKFTDHQQAVFDMVAGDDHWADSTTITVSFPVAAAAATSANIAGQLYVASQEVSPRQVNAICAIKVPDAEVPQLADKLRRLSVAAAGGGFSAPVNGVDWGNAVTSDGGFTYYAVTVPDAPVGAIVKAEDLTELQLRPSYIDTDQWRRTLLGHLGITFAEQYPGVSPTTTTQDQTPATAELLSPVFDLDEAANQRGEFHISVELTMSGQHSSVSFARDQPNPTAEDRKLTFSKIIFASDLLEEDAWAYSSGAGTRDNGIVIGRRNVFAASTRQGRYVLLLIRDSNNQVGLYRHWEGVAGSSGLRISAEVRVTFTPADTAIPEAAARGDKIASVAVNSTGSDRTIPSNAGSPMAATVTVENAFATAFSTPGQGQLNIPRIAPVKQAGFIVEGVINSIVVSRAFVPSLILAGLGGTQARNFTHSNVNAAVIIPLSNDTTRRAVGMEFQRQLSTSHNDIIRFYAGGAGNNTYKANTRIDIYQWLA